MQIKIKTLNKDGSIAFEGVFDENEASLILEVGTNYLLTQGTLPFLDEAEEEEGWDGVTSVEGSDTVQ